MWIAVALLLIVWLAALLFSYTFSGLIHLVPLVAVLVVILSLWTSRRKKYSRY